MAQPDFKPAEYPLVFLVEEYTAPTALLESEDEVDLKLAVLNVVEDALNPDFRDGEMVNEQIENSAFDCASVYELPTKADLIAILAHRVMRDSRMAEMAPVISKSFTGVK